MRADSGIQHHAHRRQAAAPAVAARRAQQLLYLLRRQNADALLLHHRHIHLLHRVFAAPATLHSRAEHRAEHAPCLRPLARGAEGLLYVRSTLLRAYAAHPPLRQPLATFHEAPCHIAVVAQRPRTAFFPRRQRLRHRLFKAHRLLLPLQLLRTQCYALQRTLHLVSTRLQRSPRHQCRLHDVNARPSQYLQRCYLFRCVRIHKPVVKQKNWQFSSKTERARTFCDAGMRNYAG